MSMIPVPEFTLLFKGNYYLVSEEDERSIKVQSVQSGQSHIFPIINLDEKSGNAHLQFELHGVAITEFCRRKIAVFAQLYCGEDGQ